MEKERCVRCGKQTPYDINTPITTRLFFIEGAGQLCEACWNQLWPTKEEKDDGKRKSTIKTRMG